MGGVEARIDIELDPVTGIEIVGLEVPGRRPDSVSDLFKRLGMKLVESS